MNLKYFFYNLVIKVFTMCNRVSNEESGMTTVEYAIGTLAAAAFAGILLVAIKEGGIKEMILNVIKQAFTMQ